MLSSLHHSAAVTMTASRLGITTTVKIGARNYYLQSYFGRRNPTTVYVSDEYQDSESRGLMRNRGTFTNLTMGHGDALAELAGVDADDIENSVDFELPLMSARDNRELAALLHPFLAAHLDGVSTFAGTPPCACWSRTVKLTGYGYGSWALK